MTNPEEPEFELVMPFVTVTSKGGPHDDDSYTAGWSMGHLDAVLDFLQPPAWNDMIRADCEPQADRIAMKHGYTATFTRSSDDWLHMELMKVAAL